MKTYDEILNSMREKYYELSGNQVPEYSDIDLRFKVLAGEIYKEQVNLEFIKNQMFLSTATGEYLDLHAADRGITRKPAVKATGNVRFIIPAALETRFTIPAGTIVATSGSVAYQYETVEEAYIPAGDVSVGVRCIAKEGGAGGNAVVGSINVLVTTVPGIHRVKNVIAFSGGSDIESDESLRARVAESFNAIPNGTNKAYYKSLALSVPGVTSASVVAGQGSVDVYICTNKDEASDELVEQVQSLISKERELNVSVLVMTATPVKMDFGISISLDDDYDFDSVASQVKQVVTNYIHGLEIGENIILNQIGKEVLQVEGVINYEFDEYFDNQIVVEDNTFVVLQNVTVNEVAI